jgi:methylenetetrahydrofolate reductase (NADPH)
MSKSAKDEFNYKSTDSRLKENSSSLELNSLLTHLQHPKSKKEFQDAEEPDAVKVSEYWGKKNDFIQDLKVSFEFFPPRVKSSNQSLKKTYKELSKINPEYYSITFGAMGSSQNSTFDTVSNISKETNVPVMPHISCIRTTKSQVTDLIDKYIKQGISQVMVLRGDIPERMINTGDFKYATDLVRFIKERYENIDIYVAAYPEKHPQSPCISRDIDFFVEKVHSGATHAITQYFYNSDAYFFFADELQKRNIDIPITPGIMPITSFDKLTNFSKVCGAEIPAWILNNLKLYKNDTESLREFGQDVVNEICLKLKQNGVNRFHFYSMNEVEPVLSLSKNLT